MKVYGVAEKARSKNLDPSEGVEITLAKSLGEKVIGLIATLYPQLIDSGALERILELEKKYGKMDTTVAFKIAEDIAKQKFCTFKNTLEAIDAGIRVGFSYITLGVVSSPIEGYTELKIGKTREGKEYFIAYFSGPIRSAGTTATCVVLMIMDFLREMFGYAKYDPSEEESRRYVTENYDYHDRVTNLQYLPTEEEAYFLAQRIPIQIAGDPTEKMEVSNYKNLERVDTNRVRGGMCLAFSEGLAQKAKKGLRLLKKAKNDGVQSTGWDFLNEYVELHEKRNTGEVDASPVYIKDSVAGRPIFGHPSRSGSFRFRYGRGRTSGFSAASVHPATMAVTDKFIAIGTQLKIEKPAKGCAVTSCDTIDGPIIKLFNGSVKKIKDRDEAERLYPDIEEILYIGDLLFPFSDVLNRNAMLLKPGYVEEWWALELEEKDKIHAKKIDHYNVKVSDAITLSEKYKIPLHPQFIFYWTEVSKEEFLNMLEWIKRAQIINKKIVLPYGKESQEKYALGKRAFELIGLEHEVTIENVVLSEENSLALFINLGLERNLLEKEDVILKNIVNVEKFFSEESILKLVNKNSLFTIKDKAGTFIGARMGKPEKAKLRKLTGSPNVLFPVGREGGRMRSVNAAYEGGFVKNKFPNYFCGACNEESLYPSCDVCNNKCERQYYCRECKTNYKKEKCEIHDKVLNSHSYREIDLKKNLDRAKEKIGFIKDQIPKLIKGVRGLMSSTYDVEHLSKGILRASHNLQVNKDGTIRFDANELPLVAFKAKEIGVTVEKLKELGYTQDIYGKDLKEENQVLELMPHDILLPNFSEKPDERAGDIFLRISQFMDDLLEKFYGIERFYNAKKKEDLVGHFGVCMAPHNCAGVICRIIGFSKVAGLLASPYMHAAIRRDCDGDEAAVMLLGDVLINFSRKFLPSHRGGTQDAPLVLNARIDAGEVDDQILDFEFSFGYPLELYQLAEQGKHSSEVTSIDNVRKALAEGRSTFTGIGFTHDTNNFNDGVSYSNYKKLDTMQEKLKHQMELVEKIRATDTADAARLVIDRHFIRDLLGNLRSFSTQSFRCVDCNEILRRPPLSGVCTKCRGKLIFTIHEGGIKKYLDPALDLAKRYGLSDYVKARLNLVKEYIDSIFGKELEKQNKLDDWF